MMKVINPVVDGWYADPESRVYDGVVYMYVTNSLPFEDQQNLDLVITKDLETYEVVRDILDRDTYVGVEDCVWAPTVVEKNGKYYLIFAANNIRTEEEVGGLYLGVCDTPRGPFKNVFADGRPLINKIYNNAQPIDAHFFKDTDGTVYLYYGGWGHMMVCIMNETMDGLVEREDFEFDKIAHEITPKEYVEAPYVMNLGGKYHLMYSTGDWMNGTYRVKAGVANTPVEEFVFYDDILQASELADGPGHNSAFEFEGQWYVAYHRRTVGDLNPHHRKLCIDRLSLDGDKINPVVMTKEWDL